MDYIERKITPALSRGAEYFPVTVVTGPRQSGKSTLCQHVFDSYARFNLEDIALRESVSNDPKGFLIGCGEKVIIDEAQNLPDLFSYIQIAVDENPKRRFILTGSNNFALLEKITQSLAGRAILFTLLPLSLEEVGAYAKSPTDDLLYNGFYPSVITGTRPADLFFPAYYSTYIERDVRQIKNLSDISQFQRFIRLLAGRAGCELNASQIATETGVSSPTIKSWISILESSYVAFTLAPYYSNINKRLTKTPKIYFYDTGLLCFLLGIETPEQLMTHPLRGGIFENLAVIELMKSRFNSGKQPNLCYYRENSGKEVDIVRMEGENLDIFEVKSSHTFNKSFLKNLSYLKDILGDKVRSAKLVYDGEYIPPSIINIRDIAK